MKTSSLHDIQFSYALRIVYKHKQLSQNREYNSAGCESGIGTGACENARQYGHNRHHTLLSQLPHHSRTERHGRHSHAYCAQGRTLGDPTRGGG